MKNPETSWNSFSLASLSHTRISLPRCQPLFVGVAPFSPASVMLAGDSVLPPLFLFLCCWCCAVLLLGCCGCAWHRHLFPSSTAGCVCRWCCCCCDFSLVLLVVLSLLLLVAAAHCYVRGCASTRRTTICLGSSSCLLLLVGDLRRCRSSFPPCRVFPALEAEVKLPLFSS